MRVERGLFADALGQAVKLTTSTFDARSLAIEALFSDAMDGTCVGPNPTVNGFVQSDAEAVRAADGAG